MGWLINDRGLPYGETPDSYLRKQFEHDRDGWKLRILASGMAGGAWYAAAEITEPERAKPYVIAIVVLVTTRGGSFGWKSMDEAMGPNACDAPDKVMRLLTPVPELKAMGVHVSYSQDWRDRVAAAKANKAKARAAKEALTAGCIVKIREGVSYGLRGPFDTFRMKGYQGRQPYFEPVNAPGFYVRVNAARLAEAEITVA